MADAWLPTLITRDPESGFALAVKMSRVAVKMTQPDDGVRKRLREEYEGDFAALIAVSGVVATNFQTIALANGHWTGTV